MAHRTLGALEILRHTPFHRGALRVGEGLQHVAARAGERAVVVELLFRLLRRFDLGERGVCPDGHDGLLVREQEPVAILFRDVTPRYVDVVAHRRHDVAQVLPLPRAGPRGDRAFAKRERVVRYHRALRRFVLATETVALGTGAGRRVRREVFGVQLGLLWRIAAGARIEHA